MIKVDEVCLNPVTLIQFQSKDKYISNNGSLNIIV